MKKLPAIFAVLRIATGIVLSAGPASAQSFCTCDGTGNVLQFTHKADVPLNGKTALDSRALRAFASDNYGGSGPNSQDVNGGGSPGYNEMLRNF
jgi:hypothetical protein